MNQFPVRSPSMMKVFLRGLAISLPSVLTLVILLWIGSLLQHYIIAPTNSLVTFVLAQGIDNSIPSSQLQRLTEGPSLPYCQHDYLVTSQAAREYQQLSRTAQQQERGFVSEETRQEWLDQAAVYVPMGNRGVPYADYAQVARQVSDTHMPRTHTGLYMELAVVRHFTSVFHLSLIAVLLLISAIYLMGRVVTVRVGAWFVRKFETIFISSLPVVRNVYGSVKKVTDFLFSENQIEVRRVIAFEYPRCGIWTIGFVTGDSLLDIGVAAGEPCVSVLVPTSPMPMTGYTMSVPRSHVIDLDISVEQAFQYIVSCGVLVPEHQRCTSEILRKTIADRIANHKPNTHATTETL